MISGVNSQMQVFLHEDDQWCGSVRTPKCNVPEIHFLFYTMAILIITTFEILSIDTYCVFFLEYHQ